MMFNIVRRSQRVGLMAMDSGTATRFGTVKEVWVDDQRRVSYLAGSQGYTPPEQATIVGLNAVLTYSDMVVDPPATLHRLHCLAIRSPLREPLGWVEDFLFNWETGDIDAYVLGGEIAALFGGRAVLFPEDVESIDAEVIVIREVARDRLKSESEGLKGFLSEKSQPVKNLVRQMGDRLQSLVLPDNQPEVVRVRITDVSDELATSGQHDKNALQEATEFLQEKWAQFQQSLNRAGKRMKSAVDSAWKRLTHK